MRLGVLLVVVAACHTDHVLKLQDADTSPPTLTVDVVVVGAGTSGTAAAIAALRHGANVFVVEPSNWVGGQMAPVPHLEDAVDGGGFHMTPRTGFVDEVRLALVAHYAAIGNTVEVRGVGRVATEPRVLRDTLVQLLFDTGVSVKMSTDVVSVQRDGNTVTGVTLGDGTIVHAKVVIDATETGDVLPLAGAEYRVGNQDSAGTIDPNACIQAITYVTPIRKYATGVPAELAIASPPPDYATLQPGFAGAVQANATTYPVKPWSWAEHNQYRAVPDSAGVPYVPGDSSTITRTSVNFANDFAATVGYVEDRTIRHDTDCAAKLVTLEFIYFAQHELGGEHGELWSVADDEGFDNSDDCPNIPAELAPLAKLFPPRPYIRESRRLVAMHMLTGHELERDSGHAATAFHTAISRGYYSMDLHGCNDPADRDLGDDTLDLAVINGPPGYGYGPLEVPLESLIPVAIDGLVAAEKNIGQSRVANGATRLEGATMLIGQAAGTLAAIAAKHGVQPRAVDPFEIQQLLVADGDGISMDLLGDVPVTDPHWAAIQLAITRGVMRETAADTFGFAAPLTRADAAYSLATVLKLPTPNVASDFADVLASNPDLPYIEAIFHAGLTSGCGGGNFCPTAALTRAQLAVFLAKGVGGTLLPCTAAPFPDVLATDPTCPAIQYATAAHLMTGCATGFCPATAVTRPDTASALVATMIQHGAPP